MPQHIEYNGDLHEFPDDFTDSDISAALAQIDGSSKTSSGNEASDVANESGSFHLSDLADAAKGFIKGAGRSVQSLGDLPHVVGLPGLTDATDALYGLPKGASKQSMQATNPAQKLGGYGETVVEMAPAVAGARAVPGMVARAAGISKVRAAANLTDAAKGAAGVAIDLTKPEAAAARIVELGQRGASVPRVTRSFLRRTSGGPFVAPMPFEEARDYYSNISRLSADEFGRLNPVVKRAVGSMREALHESLVKAAEQAGKGEEYTQGMTEYARNARVAAKAKVAGKAAAAGAAGTVGAAGAYSLIQRLLGK